MYKKIPLYTATDSSCQYNVLSERHSSRQGLTTAVHSRVRVPGGWGRGRRGPDLVGLVGLSFHGAGFQPVIGHDRAMKTVVLLLVCFRCFMIQPKQISCHLDIKNCGTLALLRVGMGHAAAVLHTTRRHDGRDRLAGRSVR